MKKIIFYIVFSGLIGLSGTGFAHDESSDNATDSGRNITVNFENTPLKDAINEIAESGDLKLNYAENIIPQNKLITLSMKNTPAIRVLQRVLLGTGLVYKVLKNNQIVIQRYENPDGSFSIPRFTISGYINDEETGEALIGANVFFPGISTGCATNKYGFYSITLNEGIYDIRYTYIGYGTITRNVELGSDKRINIDLKKQSITGDTVIVTAMLDSPVLTTALGTIDLVPEKLSSIPILFGEHDLLKTLHLLPGVSAYKEGDGGLYIRGGDSDQNLLLLDEAPIFNPYHFFGFFSIFNSEAIKNVKLIKGAAPARYGGRISSVIDIQLKEGNVNNFNGSAGIGLIFSRLNLEGPLFGNRGSYMISGRRTYLDLFKYLSDDQSLRDSRLYFYDINAKANYKIDDNDRLYISGYIGNDILGFTDDLEVGWGNKTATLRWNHLFNNRLFANSSLVFSNFTHHTFINDNDENNRIDVLSKVNDITFKWDFQYFFNERNLIQFGANFINHTFLPADISATGAENFDIEIGKRTANEFSLYLSDEFSQTEKLKFNLGMRFTLFSVSGEPDVFDFPDSDTEINIDFHKAEKKIYVGAEPRFSTTYIFDENNSLKLGYARNFQYLHMVSNSNSGSPLDIWQPVSKNVKPLVCDQLSAGYFNTIKSYDLEFSAELFYKKMDNLIDYKDGADLALRTYFESEYVFGKGNAYGLELFLKKHTGRFRGWIGYTLSRSERIFPDINNGKPFPAKFDRTHDISLVLMYDLSSKWNVSANWVYATGNAITVPYGKYELAGHTFEAYSARNSYRIPAYHRLDLSLTYKTDSDSQWIFSLYNAYGKRNVYAIVHRDKEGIPGSKEAVRLALFSIVPSITYSMNF